MENFVSLSNVTSLTEEENKTVNGGQPTEDTNFWYDAFYVITFSILTNPRPTAMSGMINGNVVS